MGSLLTLGVGVRIEFNCWAPSWCQRIRNGEFQTLLFLKEKLLEFEQNILESTTCMAAYGFVRLLFLGAGGVCVYCAVI